MHQNLDGQLKQLIVEDKHTCDLTIILPQKQSCFDPSEIIGTKILTNEIKQVQKIHETC